ncbi:DoxX family protein [Alteromonas aestuariivivens]|uniref:DoxX family protein n=1 Tax=Alteromonas aestuariivivens TaxID=1938339 RepID=A0A3D8MA25_9ALTE|nr:DoxX family protein [Alteromonas aestuariivivens]RDV26160.1 DoxX family protein [Alteromonas aestuariivivens]
MSGPILPALQQRLQKLDGVPLLMLRLYLAPVMLQAGWNKVVNFEQVVTWFGNVEWGLGLPMPALQVTLAIGAELLGGIFLLLGLFTRLSSIPLIFTMLVAAVMVHWENGWLAIADPQSWLANGVLLYDESVVTSAEKLQRANSLLQEYGHYDWLTSSGKLVILNNGMEFAITYLVMLLVLLAYGGGRYVSADYWLRRASSNLH